jgi:hypothetical protein
MAARDRHPSLAAVHLPARAGRGDDWWMRRSDHGAAAQATVAKDILPARGVGMSGPAVSARAAAFVDGSDKPRSAPADGSSRSLRRDNVATSAHVAAAARGVAPWQQQRHEPKPRPAAAAANAHTFHSGARKSPSEANSLPSAQAAAASAARVNTGAAAAADDPHLASHDMPRVDVRSAPPPVPGDSTVRERHPSLAALTSRPETSPSSARASGGRVGKLSSNWWIQHDQKKQEPQRASPVGASAREPPGSTPYAKQHPMGVVPVAGASSGGGGSGAAAAVPAGSPAASTEKVLQDVAADVSAYVMVSRHLHRERSRRLAALDAEQTHRADTLAMDEELQKTELHIDTHCAVILEEAEDAQQPPQTVTQPEPPRLPAPLAPPSPDTPAAFSPMVWRNKEPSGEAEDWEVESPAFHSDLTDVRMETGARSDHLVVHVATWNLGNAAPPPALNNWLPPHGGGADIVMVAVQESYLHPCLWRPQRHRPA